MAFSLYRGPILQGSLAMWLKKLVQRFQNRPRSAQRRHGQRLGVERLEDRTVPSSVTAASVSDLIADINAANLAGGANTITLAAGKSFTLTAPSNTGGTTGLPAIAANDNLTIVGNGDVIQRSSSKTTPAFEILYVGSGATLTLQNLTVAGGVAPQGGGIYNAGSLTLSNVIVQNNLATTGPAWGGGIYSSGSLTMTGGAIQNNEALGIDGLSVSSGGNKHSAYVIDGGVLYATPGNSACGGGLYVSGLATLTGVTIASNLAQGGNGGDGGAAGYSGVVGTLGGSAYGGGVYAVDATLTMTGCTVSSNKAQGGQGSRNPTGSDGNGVGGGLFVTSASTGSWTLTLHNDTITSNSAHGNFGSGGGLVIGGQIPACLDAFTVANVLNNTAASDPDIEGSYTIC
jgi:hypothetical protein